MPKKAQGTTLSIGANVVADLTSISGLELTADTIDVTTLADTYRKFLQGLKDAGEVTVEGFLNEDDTTGQIAIHNAYKTGAESTFTITFPATVGAEWDFNAIVTGVTLGGAIEMEEALSFAATLKVSGEPTLTLPAP
ncbi:phage tail tube protein [Paenibacillus sp.]|uniref:phage tail tube protein n=1 Tax=Paenibacillus sp. TaxID=58172 RepID=UPI002D3E0431|nr:phage tail tube protein [Paenibacillus sp.]HZG83832.1 phage tail tube protein [Paenibacillus sp.]